VVCGLLSRYSVVCHPPTARVAFCAQGRIGDLEFTVIDTGGLDDRHALESNMLPLTRTVLQNADVVLLIVDARRGVTPDDKHFVQYVDVRVTHATGPVVWH
jgi:GTP-binding protein